MSDLLKQTCKLMQITQLRTTPAHPEGNGRVERVHRTIIKMLSHYVSSKHDNWDACLPYLVNCYNAKMHSSTGLSPYEIVYGRKMRSPLDFARSTAGISNEHVRELAKKLKEAWKGVKQRNHQSFLQQAKQHDRQAVTPQYRVGDLVYLSNVVLKKSQVKKFKKFWKGPYPILEVLSPVTLKLQLPFRSIVVHVNRVKPYLSRFPVATQDDDEDRPRGRPAVPKSRSRAPRGRSPDFETEVSPPPGRSSPRHTYNLRSRV